LLIFAKYLSLYLHIFTCTYKGTHTQAHMYNQHTRGMATFRHRSLVERGGRKALLDTLHTQTKKKKWKKNVHKKSKFTNLKKRFEHIELPAKLPDSFLRSNKSNINQKNHRLSDDRLPLLKPKLPDMDWIGNSARGCRMIDCHFSSQNYRIWTGLETLLEFEFEYLNNSFIIGPCNLWIIIDRKNIGYENSE